MSWPTGHDRITAHVAAEPAGGVIKCARCNAVLHANRHGTDPPWHPGQAVGMSDTKMVRMALRPGHGHQECAVPDETEAPAG
jgi:hypothetical protein